MRVYSNQDIFYTTKNYKRLEHLEDLAYEVVTSEEFKCKFRLISKGLYVLKMNENIDEYFFGKEIPDNGTDFRIAIYHVILSKNADKISNEIIGVLRLNNTSITDDNKITGVDLADNSKVIDKNNAIETADRSK